MSKSVFRESTRIAANNQGISEDSQTKKNLHDWMQFYQYTMDWRKFA